jgi:hypothetical protein
MTTATAEDRAAAALLLGIEASPARITFRSMEIRGSSGFYHVEEREDTRHGGTYVYCPCPGWGFQMGKGKLCRHAQYATDEWTR